MNIVDFHRLFERGHLKGDLEDVYCEKIETLKARKVNEKNLVCYGRPCNNVK